MPQKPWLANDHTIRDRVVLSNPYKILSTLAGAIGLPAGTAQMSDRQFRWPRFSNLRRPGNRPVLTTHYLTCTPEERYAQRRLLLQELNPEREIPFRLTAADTLPPNDLIVAFGPWDCYLDPASATWGVRSLNWQNINAPVVTALLTGAMHYEDGPNVRQRAQVIEQAAANLISNPSFETNLAGWALTDAAPPSVTITRVVTYYKFGIYSVEIINQIANEDSYFAGTVACVGATTYTLTAWVNIPDFTAPAILNRGFYVDDGFVSVFVPITAKTDGWVRLEMSITTNVAAANLSVRLYAPHAVCYWDGIQVEQSGYASTYLDGSLGPGYTWAGTPHGSASTRAATQFNMDSKVSLISDQSKLTFRAVVRMPYEHDAGATGWPDAVTCYLFDARGVNDNNRIIIWYDVVNELWRVYINGAVRISSGAQTFNAGDWLEFVLALNFDADVYVLYINGVVAGTSVAVLNPPTLKVDWQLGSHYNAATQMGNFWFAEYDVFDKILTPDEITQLVTQGSSHLRARYLNCITEVAQPLVLSGTPTNRGDVSTLSVDEDVRWRSRDGDLHGTGIVENSYKDYITVDSDDYVIPVISLKPTAARAAQCYNYRIDIFVIWKGVATNLYPVSLKPAWNTTVPVGAGKMQANGNDLRVFVDGVEVKRWVDGPNTATTEVFINMDFQQSVSSALTEAAGIAETHLHLVDVTKFPNSGMAYLATAAPNNEVISWTGRDLVNNTLTGVKRGLKGTAGFNHIIGVTVWWMQHDVVIVYGNNTATAPNSDNQNRPMFNLDTSTNSLWQYLDYGTAGPFHRPYSWQWEVIQEYLSGTVMYPVRYTAHHGANADPWSEIGQINTDSGSVVGVESISRWKLYHPLGITSVVFRDAEKQRNAGVTITAEVQSSLDGVTWTQRYDILDVAGAAWENWAGLPLTVATANDKWVGVWASENAAAFTYIEVSTCDVNIKVGAGGAPDVYDKGEQPNYQIDLYIKNITNGDLMKVYGNLFLNDTIHIDCYNREVILISTALRQNSLIAIYSDNFEWFRLERGLNELLFTTVSPGQINFYIYWHRRDWE